MRLLEPDRLLTVVPNEVIGKRNDIRWRVELVTWRVNRDQQWDGVALVPARYADTVQVDEQSVERQRPFASKYHQPDRRTQIVKADGLRRAALWHQRAQLQRRCVGANATWDGDGCQQRQHLSPARTEHFWRKNPL